MTFAQRFTSQGLKPYFGAILLLLVVFVWLAKLHPVRVGDGSEYYAMFLAWVVDHKPWMTTAAYKAYDALYSTNYIRALVPSDIVANQFPALKTGDTSDFNHFWFYSFAAVICWKIASVVGVTLTIHQSFLALHFLLLLFLVTIANYYAGWRGIVAVILMTFGSPIVWFTNKVHTEFFTYCLTTAAVIFIYSRRYAFGAMMLAIASTQNPSFALVAFVPFAYRFVLERSRPYTALEVLALIATALAVLMHPLYYLMRLGVPTPQLLAGGASLGGELSWFYIWILDLDIGLLPNWPLGLIVLIAAAALALYHRRKSSITFDVPFAVFVFLYYAISFYAQSSTTNLNSGATTSVARYALWYIALFFPIFLFVISKLSKRPYLWGTTGVIAVIFSLLHDRPNLGENYTTPTALSYAVQRYLPSLYTPPAEIFAERYSGYGEGIYSQNIRGVLGPDCRRLLLYPGPDRNGVAAPAYCLDDQEKLTAYANNHLGVHGEAFYVNIETQELTALAESVSLREYEVGLKKPGNFAIGTGWSSPEEWGMWSNGKAATLILPCEKLATLSPNRALSLVLKLNPFGEQTLDIKQDENTVWAGKIAEAATISVPLSFKACPSRMTSVHINISNPQSPQELGVSSDGRRLGIGLEKFILAPG